MKDYYKILQIAPTASDEIVRAAYRAMAKLYHPDTTKYEKSVAEQRMKEINEAYQVLSDPIQREEYDAQFQRSHNQSPPKEGTSKTASAESTVSKGTDVTDTAQASASVRQDAPEPSPPPGEKVPQSKLGRLFHFVYRCFADEMQHNRQRYENAYLSGTAMHDSDLVYYFKHSAGPERMGYSKVLEERGLLVRNNDDKLVPNDNFNLYWD